MSKNFTLYDMTGGEIRVKSLKAKKTVRDAERRDFFLALAALTHVYETKELSFTQHMRIIKHLHDALLITKE